MSRVDFFCSFAGCVFGAGEASMVGDLAFMAPRYTAARAIVFSDLFLTIACKEVVAVLSRAVNVVSWVAALSDHFPFESLQSGQFLRVQEDLEVVYGR